MSYGSVSKLLTRLTDIFRNYFGFPHPDARLLAYFCLSTWVADRLAMAPSLAILAPERERGIEITATPSQPMSSATHSGGTHADRTARIAGRVVHDSAD